EPRRTQTRPRYHRFGAWRPSGGAASGLTESGEDAEPAFFVGETRAARLHASLPDELNDHGFRLRKIGNKIFFRGRSPAASQFAVYRVLDRYGDVRWYLPTELGAHVPEFRSELPRRIDDVEEPDFISRRWGRATLSQDGFWEARNLMGYG